MTLLIGTDEAGYGPNLGPLMVAATVWRIEAGMEDAEPVLSRALAEVEGLMAAHAGTRSPLWADSKQIYRAGAGFDMLERGVLLGLLLSAGDMPDTWATLHDSLGPISPRGGCRREWQGLPSLRLPRDMDADRCAVLVATVRETLTRHGVAVERVACRGIYPDEFNTLLHGGLNKSDILSAATLDLAASLRADRPDIPALIWCDRHGGRKRYGGLVARHFDTPLVQPLEETPVRSAYLVPAGGEPRSAACRIEFCVGGESRAPVALASMTAKYVRELSMLAFNAFWAERVPGLLPTAGYPTDALRWRRDTAAAVERERLETDDLWRRA